MKIKSVLNHPGGESSINFWGRDTKLEPLTGWYCSVCDGYAQVMASNETMCRKHAKEWQHGMGKTITQMKEEL